MTPGLLDDAGQLATAILTRRLRKCIAEGAHLGSQPEATEPAKCPRCGLELANAAAENGGP